jgi:hypothetical protein
VTRTSGGKRRPGLLASITPVIKASRMLRKPQSMFREAVSNSGLNRAHNYE